MCVNKMTLSALALLSVATLPVYCGEVKVTNRTWSCCHEMKMPINKTCRFEFSIGKEALAAVDKIEENITEPFVYNSKEQVMGIKSCTNFTVKIFCDNGEGRVNHHMILCQKPVPGAIPSAGAIVGAIVGAILVLFLVLFLVLRPTLLQDLTSLFRSWLRSTRCFS